MAKRKRLKKQVYYVLFLVIIIIIGTIFGINKYKEYKYHQTQEYKLLEHGYKMDDVKLILKKFNDKDIDFFLNNEVNEDYLKLTKEEYYLKRNFYKYIDYMKNNKKLDLKTVIRNINIHLDKDFYKANLVSDTTLDTSLLVNKYYLLPSDYEPSDLVTISQTYSWGELGTQKTRKIVYDAFLEMWNAAKEEMGFYLMISSSYRSYQDQEIVYNNYKNKQGTKYADKIAARPGASEHQSGLALDIFSKNNSNRKTFQDTEEAKWLKDNAYKYGFILRYPEDKVNITGYDYESWHYRYVGKEIASYIHNKNIVFEEYYAFYIEK